MPELNELKIRLRSLQKSPIYAKPAAAEEALECAVRVLAVMDQRISTLEKGAGDGGKK